ncbi:MAG: hypothetical protein ABI678_19430 [Kofleriaceae bacterium]
MSLRVCFVLVLGLVGCRKATPDHHAPAEVGSATGSVAHQGEACPTGTTCDHGLTCVAYRGVGGNELHSCEIPCEDGAPACPAGQSCSTVKDGPGRVCISTGGGETKDAAPPPADAGPVTGHQRMACVNGACDPGLACVKYRGIGGQELSSCEIPCDAKTACPSGQGCGVVADGPGQVCIPSGAPPPRDAGTTGAAPPRAAKQGERCGKGTTCASGMTCVDYRGVTGAELHSCEIPCGGGVTCPTGQGCMTVRDGPGQVCVATGAPPPVPVPESGQGKACTDGKCGAGLECIEYYGIAGPRGPKFTSCEIRCSADKPCTKPQRCVTIADGPGQVCRR